MGELKNRTTLIAIPKKSAAIPLERCIEIEIGIEIGVDKKSEMNFYRETGTRWYPQNFS